MATKKAIFKAHLAKWLAAKGDRKKRGKMIKEISNIAKIHPKSVSRSFKRIQIKNSLGNENRGSPTYYTNDVRSALYDVWESANRPCGELLKPVIKIFIDGFKQANRWNYSEKTTKKLLKMSEITVKRFVGGLRKKYGEYHGKGTTKSSHLKQIIPIFKGPWDDLNPGNGQLDTVAHCGNSIAGDFVYSLSFVDAPTYWGVRQAQWNKGQEATKNSLINVKKRLPFPWLMGHPDTGSEFINYLTKNWCDDNEIALTRSEPGKKNDNMYVEERNGHVIRKYLGWQRLNRKAEIVKIINVYYERLDLYLNHFQAVRRTLSKEKIGSKYRRIYEKKAKTPYQRLIEHPQISKIVKRKVKKQHKKINPLLLKEELDILRKRIFNYQKQGNFGAK